MPSKLERHRNVEFVLAEVTGIDAAGRHVQERRPLGEQFEFDYDCLILASFGPKLSALAARDLKNLGVELHMGSIVTEADLQCVQVKDHAGNLAGTSRRRRWPRP